MPGGFGPMSGGQGASTAAPAATPLTPKQLAQLPKYNGARDPFKVAWQQPPAPPYIFQEVEPLRVASAGVEAPPAAPVTVREVPDRRVSGIMTGSGVFAILEQNGDSEIVKPGSVTQDGYRVMSITSDTVRLQKKEGNVILTQTVPLTDIATGPTGMGGAGNRFGAPGGYPGGFPGAPGFPGGGRPGMPGTGGAGGGGGGNTPGA